MDSGDEVKWIKRTWNGPMTPLKQIKVTVTMTMKEVEGKLKT
jgi:hypothetical protein